MMAPDDDDNNNNNFLVDKGQVTLGITEGFFGYSAPDFHRLLFIIVVQLITKQQNRLTKANRFGNQRTSVVVAKGWFRIPDSVRTYNNLGIGVSMEIVCRKEIIINTNLFDEHGKQIAKFIV